jgi:hypothetical protein
MMNVEDDSSESVSSSSLSSSSSSEDNSTIPIPTAVSTAHMEIGFAQIGLQRRRNTMAMYILTRRARRERRYIYCRARFTEWIKKMQHNVEFRREVRMDFDAFHTLRRWNLPRTRDLSGSFLK